MLSAWKVCCGLQRGYHGLKKPVHDAIKSISELLLVPNSLRPPKLLLSGIQSLTLVLTLGRPIAQRWVFTIMGAWASLNAYAMRNCLSLALTEMVNSTSSLGTEAIDETLCPVENTTATASSSTSGTFNWDSETQGLILSAFFWGYVITHIPGGMLADKFGGKYTLGLGIFSTAIFTLMTPVVVKWGDSTALIILRFLMGLGEGTTFPAMSALLAKWVPPASRSRMGSLVFTGTQLGTIFASAVSGLLLQYSPMGWPSVFYFFGAVGVLWFLIFTVVCYSSPESHPFISDEEKKYIQDATCDPMQREIPPPPWRHILKSFPVWSLVIAQVGHDWGLFTMITDLPLYMSDVLHFSIKSNGLLTALPYIAMWIVAVASSPVADWLINSEKMSIGNVRKLFTTIGSMGPAVFLIAASYAGCDRVVVVSLFTIGMGLMGMYYPGMRVNAIDLSSNYAGTLTAIINGLGAVSGMITPYLVGILTPNETVAEWRLVFWIVFGVFAVTNAVYLVGCSGEIQYWNDPGFLISEKEKRGRSKSSANNSDTSNIDDFHNKL